MNSDPYVAAMIWRLEHMTEADHRAADEQGGMIVRALRRRRLRAPAPTGARRPAGLACET